MVHAGLDENDGLACPLSIPESALNDGPHNLILERRAATAGAGGRRRRTVMVALARDGHEVEVGLTDSARDGDGGHGWVMS